MHTFLKLLNDARDFFFHKRIYQWRTQFNNCIIKYPIRYFDGEEYITSDENLFLEKNSFLATFPVYAGYKYSPQIKFGKNVYINFNCQITATNSIIIGDDVLIGSNVTITDHLHGDPRVRDTTPPKKRALYSKGGGSYWGKLPDRDWCRHPSGGNAWGRMHRRSQRCCYQKFSSIYSNCRQSRDCCAQD